MTRAVSAEPVGWARPTTPSDGFKPSGIARIPSDWEVTSLDTVLVTAQYGLSVRGSSTGRYPILRMNCQKDGRVLFRDLQFVDLKDRLFDAFRLRDGDILFNRTNSFELVGRTAIFKGDDPAVFASYLIRLQLDGSRVVPEFLNYYFGWDVTQAGLKSLATRGVSQSNISASKLRLFPIALPPLPEQRAIAAVLAKIHAAVEVQAKIVATLKELKAATMAKLFREGLRGEPLKPTEIGEIPESWEGIKLGKCCRVASGGTPPRDVAEYWNGTIPWVKTGEIDYRPITSTEEHITEAGLQNSSAQLFPKGTLLMAMYGQGVTRGKAALLEIEAATNQACAALIPDESVDVSFLYTFCSFAYKRIRELGHGANQQNLSANLVREILVPRPKSLQEQRSIAHMIRAIETRLHAVERRLDALRTLFSSMLHQLMTGQVRVTC